MKIETERLRSGGYIARPAGSLGTIGWSPMPWTATYGSTAEKAKRNFIANHKNKLGNP